MGDTPTQRTVSKTGILENQLADAAEERRAAREERERDRERDSKRDAKIIETLERSSKRWMYLSLALVLVLGILVSGVVGVSVSGSIPGMGDIHITEPSETPKPE